MTIWLTRPEAESARFAAALSVRGIPTIIAPVIRIIERPVTLENSDFTAILTTSQHALKSVNNAAIISHLPLFTVGNRSRKAAIDKGFSRAEILATNATSLSAAIAKRYPQPAHFLYLSGRDIRLDLAATLGAHGHRVTRIITYNAAILPELSPALLSHWPEITGVALFSARATEAVIALMAKHQLTPNAGITAFCLSDKVAAALQSHGWKNIRICPAPSEELLLASISSAKNHP
ncbi:MAG: uroporphyrinogen-III synthase [Alphaproteobacteria bacterium]